MRDKSLVSLVFVCSVIFCLMVVGADIVQAAPRQRVVVHAGGPVYGPRPVEDAPGRRTIESTDSWPLETIAEVELTPEDIKEKKIKPGYGLIAFDVYPFETKIYLDGHFEGTPTKLNREKNFLKVEEGKHIIEFKLQNAPIKVLRLYFRGGYKTIIEQ